MVYQPLQSVKLAAHGARIRPSFSALRHDVRVPTTLRASPSIGIDLGTTNSVVAAVIDGKPQIIPQRDGQEILPSIISFLEDGSVLVGNPAKRASLKQASSRLSSTKRYMGMSLAEAEATYTNLIPGSGARLVASPEDGTNVAFEPAFIRKVVTPEQAATLLLTEIVQAAASHLGTRPQRAVISVPAYFSERARQATVSAGLSAGLQKVKLIHEPVAAGLAYGVDATVDQTIMVFDLGGGTLDVSLLEVGGGAIEILSSAGDPRLGGDDWDAAVAQWMLARHRNLAVDRLMPTSAYFQARLRLTAEQARVQLSSETSVRIRMPGIPEERSPRLSRAELESMTAHLYVRAREAVDQVCWQAGVDLAAVRRLAAVETRQRSRRKRGTAADLPIPLRGDRPPLTKVLLVGGATRMPGVVRLLENMTGLRVSSSAVDPDMAVAMGAAIQAARFDGRLDGLAVMDVWQSALMRAFAGPQEGRG